MNQNSVIFTPEDIHALFKIGEQLGDICENISKCNAITEMTSEAIESTSNSGLTFTGDIVLKAVSAIGDYIRIVDTLSSELHKQFWEMYSVKRNLCVGGKVV